MKRFLPYHHYLKTYILEILEEYHACVYMKYCPGNWASLSHKGYALTPGRRVMYNSLKVGLPGANSKDRLYLVSECRRRGITDTRRIDPWGCREVGHYWRDSCVLLSR